MNAFIASMTLAGLAALAGSGAALAGGDCGMNSNKPCPAPGKSSAKEPAYKSLNSNKPAAQRVGAAPEPSTVEATGEAPAEARATLSGISASDLKIKPKTDKTIEKEPAQTP